MNTVNSIKWSKILDNALLEAIVSVVQSLVNAVLLILLGLTVFAWLTAVEPQLITDMLAQRGMVVYPDTFQAVAVGVGMGVGITALFGLFAGLEIRVRGAVIMIMAFGVAVITSVPGPVALVILVGWHVFAFYRDWNRDRATLSKSD